MKTLLYLSLAFLLLLGSNNIQAQSINLQTIETGLNSPVDIKNAGDSRLFVVEQAGLIKIVDPAGANPTTVFLDLTNLTNAGGERGLLSVAFHPNYSTNGKFYVNYTNLNGTTVIAEYNVSSTNPDVADPNGNILLTYSQPFSNHNGGCLQFGPDGFLYIASGDGGSGGDPGDRAQDNSTLLGKMLRIDVDNPLGNNAYGIPADNPFANSAGADEIYSTGLRNPWKFSFDRTTGDIWIADVGQNAIEEINRLPYTVTDANYGWRCYEGNTVFNTNGNCPPDANLTFPVATYNHSGNGPNKCSVTGGYVYRGSQNPNLQGNYFFADFCSDEIGIVTENAGNYNLSFLQQFQGESFSSFGEDFMGELYVAGLGSGTIYKITQGTASIDDQDLALAQLYPNPAENLLRVELQGEESYDLSIYDILGKQVYQTKDISRRFQLDVSDWSGGIYLVQVSNGQASQTLKLSLK
ncbi:PQQ-dependent sugar dehydrogenase [Nonlabens xiamenensis]|uniref:PQQ-dependent sugar dehydrogenase n=1 Tax=Nonlabens xiamenensis TaxID=2341043 RepID=UPI000F60D29C|nr:PQQ-dependent sugar dehydrogenase [Nonlabens xiamenensis]